MSAVVGIDLSTRALDLVKLDETTNRAEWVRCELAGGTAWERTLGLRYALSEIRGPARCSWWWDVYLVAIEAPYGRGQAGTQAALNRVVGAVAASLPTRLRVPERCWIVRPDEWKQGLGLKGKPSNDDLPADHDIHASWPQFMPPDDDHWQNARDAYCLAMYARDTNAAAVSTILSAGEAPSVG